MPEVFSQITEGKRPSGSAPHTRELLEDEIATAKANIERFSTQSFFRRGDRQTVRAAGRRDLPTDGDRGSGG